MPETPGERWLLALFASLASLAFWAVSVEQNMLSHLDHAWYFAIVGALAAIVAVTAMIAAIVAHIRGY